jgi:hypothetical protein
MENQQHDVGHTALEVALYYMGYALGILDRSNECPAISAHLDLAVTRLTDELTMRALAADRERTNARTGGHLRSVTS